MQFGGMKPWIANHNLAGDKHYSHPLSLRLCMQLKLFTTAMEGTTRTPLFTTNKIVSAFFPQLFRTITLKNNTRQQLSHRVVSTYHKPRLQQCIQRMQPTKGTHHWLHSSQIVETHTCHPGKRKKESHINYPSDVCGTKSKR